MNLIIDLNTFLFPPPTTSWQLKAEGPESKPDQDYVQCQSVSFLLPCIGSEYNNIRGVCSPHHKVECVSHVSVFSFKRLPPQKKKSANLLCFFLPSFFSSNFQTIIHILFPPTLFFRSFQTSPNPTSVDLPISQANGMMARKLKVKTCSWKVKEDITKRSRVVKGGGFQGEGGSLIFPKVPQSSLGILRSQPPTNPMGFFETEDRRAFRVGFLWAEERRGEKKHKHPQKRRGEIQKCMAQNQKKNWEGFIFLFFPLEIAVQICKK